MQVPAMRTTHLFLLKILHHALKLAAFCIQAGVPLLCRCMPDQHACRKGRLPSRSSLYVQQPASVNASSCCRQSEQKHYFIFGDASVGPAKGEGPMNAAKAELLYRHHDSSPYQSPVPSACGSSRQPVGMAGASLLPMPNNKDDVGKNGGNPSSSSRLHWVQEVI